MHILLYILNHLQILVILKQWEYWAAVVILDCLTTGESLHMLLYGVNSFLSSWCIF